MGFLKFLKREKKKEDFDELDLPPAPPPLEGFDEDIALPDFSDFGKEKISAAGDELSKFDFPEISQDFPPFSETEEEQPPIASVTAAPAIPEEISPATPSIPKPQQIAPEIGEDQDASTQGIYPKKERRLFSPEKRAAREMPNVKTVYVRVDDFKVALGGINILRNDLKKSEEALTKLENIKNSKDRSFDRMKSSLGDLQHKLIFIDKTLFKGE